MNEGYRNRLIDSFRRNSGSVPRPNPVGYEQTEWDARLYRCCRRLYAATSFRETAYSAYQKTGGALLPCIGYYYNLFHMGLAALCFEHTTSLEALVHMNHDRFHDLIHDKLVQEGFLPRGYLDSFDNLRRAREYANYFFGYRHKDKGNDAYLPTI